MEVDLCSFFRTVVISLMASGKEPELGDMLAWV